VDMRLLQEILASTRLPTPPLIAMRIIELTNDPNTTPADLTELVQADTALSAKILKTVNSAFYGLSSPVASIERAQIMLGMQAIKTLTLGFSLVESLGDDPVGGFDYVAYWKRSLIAAVCAREIAGEAECMEPEEALLGGLFQDVGVVVLHRTLGQPYDELVALAEGRHREISALELAHYDLTHSTIGATLAERWRFPATLVTPIRYHEQPTAAPRSHQSAVRCIALAGLAASALCEEDSVPALRLYLGKAKTWLGLDGPRAEGALERGSEGAREFAKLLEVNTGTPVNAGAILAEAKDRLVDLSLNDQIGEAVNAMRQGLETDPATGFPTRSVFRERMLDAHDRTVEAEGELTVALFEIIPDPAGEADPAEAEETALSFAEVLGQCCEEIGADAGRFQGPTFAMLMPGFTAVAAAGIFTKLIEGFEAENRRLGRRAKLAVGCTTLDQDNHRAFSNPQMLLTAAERALDGAKEAGETAVRSFVPALRSAA